MSTSGLVLVMHGCQVFSKSMQLSNHLYWWKPCYHNRTEAFILCFWCLISIWPPQSDYLFLVPMQWLHITGETFSLRCHFWQDPCKIRKVLCEQKGWDRLGGGWVHLKGKIGIAVLFFVFFFWGGGGGGCWKPLLVINGLRNQLSHLVWPLSISSIHGPFFS